MIFDQISKEQQHHHFLVENPYFLYLTVPVHAKTLLLQSSRSLSATLLGRYLQYNNFKNHKIVFTHQPFVFLILTTSKQ